jgi:hypothetical protein
MSGNLFDEFPLKNDIDIPVPAELEDRIIKTMERLPRRVPRYMILCRNIAASVVLSLGIFAAGVCISPDLAAAASRYPVLGEFVEWLRGDAGIRLAVEKGYQTLEPVHLEKDGFELTLRDIILDRDRLRLAAILGGPKVDEALQKREGQDIRTTSSGETAPESEKSTTPNYGLDIFFADFLCSASAFCSQEEGVITRDVQNCFNPGQLDSFLSLGKDYITVRAVVTDWQDEKSTKVIEFNDIRIPFDRALIGEEHRYLYDTMHQYSLGKVHIKALSVNPTRMKLELRMNDMDRGLFFTGFRNPRLEDGKGNAYTPGGLVSRGFPDNLSLFFVPSAYYAKNYPEKLYFCYDGIDYGTAEGRSFKVKPDAPGPLVHEYMGIPLSISKVRYDPAGTLCLELNFKPIPGFDIQEVTLNEQIQEEQGTSKSWSRTELPDGSTRIEMSFNQAPKLDEYTLTIEYPHYPLMEPGKIELSLENE